MHHYQLVTTNTTGLRTGDPLWIILAGRIDGPHALVSTTAGRSPQHLVLRSPSGVEFEHIDCYRRLTDPNPTCGPGDTLITAAPDGSIHWAP